MWLHCTAPRWPGAAAEQYLLLAAVPVLLGLLCFAQQVWEGQWLKRAGARRPGIPEGVAVPRVPPTAHRTERARAHAARRMDAVDANHGQSLQGFWRRFTGTPLGGVLQVFVPKKEEELKEAPPLKVRKNQRRRLKGK